MTTDNLVSPDFELEIAGQKYLLDGSFGTLKAIQQAFNRDIVPFQASLLDLRNDELVKLLALLTHFAGPTAKPLDETTIGTWLLDEVGIVKSKADIVLRVQLMAFLRIAMTPKQERQKKRTQMREWIDQMQAASPGESTDASA